VYTFIFHLPREAVSSGVSLVLIIAPSFYPSSVFREIAEELAADFQSDWSCRVLKSAIFWLGRVIAGKDDCLLETATSADRISTYAVTRILLIQNLWHRIGSLILKRVPTDKLWSVIAEISGSP
jgi:hypothetical protein